MAERRARTSRCRSCWGRRPRLGRGRGPGCSRRSSSAPRPTGRISGSCAGRWWRCSSSSWCGRGSPGTATWPPIAARPAVKSQLRAALAERVAADAPSALGGRRTGELVDPGHAGCRRPRRLLLALPAAARAGRDRAAHRPGRGRRRGLALGGHHRGHAPADPGVHGAHRDGDPQPHRPPAAHAAAAVGPLPRRRRRPADAQGLRPRRRRRSRPSARSPTATGGRRCRPCALAFLSALVLELLASVVGRARRGRRSACGCCTAASASRPRCSC